MGVQGSKRRKKAASSATADLASVARNQQRRTETGGLTRDAIFKLALPFCDPSSLVQTTRASHALHAVGNEAGRDRILSLLQSFRACGESELSEYCTNEVSCALLSYPSHTLHTDVAPRIIPGAPGCAGRRGGEAPYSFFPPTR